MMYDLSCTDCTFTATVNGSTDDVFDVIDHHHSEAYDNHKGHFVNIEAREETNLDCLEPEERDQFDGQSTTASPTG